MDTYFRECGVELKVCSPDAYIFQRIELGKGNEEVGQDKPLSSCFNCGFDLAKSKTELASFWNDEIERNWRELIGAIQQNQLTKYQTEQLAVLHQFVKLLSGVKSEKLLAFIESTLSIKLERPHARLRAFEANDSSVRFQVFQCAWWLLLDWPNNLHSAWLYGAIRYNQLLKDMNVIPKWYASEVDKLNVHYKRRSIVKMHPL